MNEKLSARKILLSSLHDAGLSLIPIVLKRWAWLIGVMVMTYFLEFYFIWVMEQDPSNDLLRMVGQLGLAMSALFASVVIVFLAPLTIVDEQQNRPKTSVWKFSNRFIWPLTLESLRALTQVLIWALLFILPGIYKSFRLHFLPFTVMFDPEYEKGNVDALKESERLTKPIQWWLIGFLIVSLLVEMAIDSPANVAEGLTHHVLRAIFTPITTIFSVYSVSVSFFLYQKTHKAL